MHIFTSITSNYIPKARVLAESVKRHAPHATFHVLLCDTPPANFDLGKEQIDSLILLDELEIENRQQWIFQHNVVELCTAVKGLGFQRLFTQHGAEKVIFLDPDIVLFSPLTVIEDELDQHSVLLTPHQTQPESAISAILDNEVSSLKHGVFNLGFLAVRNSSEGNRFVNWWSDRLREFCYDDRSQGLFTDQKWVDLAPAFFPDMGVLRQSEFNVSTWNINQRELSGDIENGIFVDGQPLCFYHFSGLDSGAMDIMMGVYGNGSSALESLQKWYLQQCKKNGQDTLGKCASRYATYSNGENVEPAHRLLYRYREALRVDFPDPYEADDSSSYFAWYQKHGSEISDETRQEQVASIMRHELDAIHHSITWRIFKRFALIYRRFGARFGLGRLVKRIT